jgi:hypothetical protein
MYIKPPTMGHQQELEEVPQEHQASKELRRLHAMGVLATTSAPPKHPVLAATPSLLAVAHRLALTTFVAAKVWKIPPPYEDGDDSPIAEPNVFHLHRPQPPVLLVHGCRLQTHSSHTLSIQKAKLHCQSACSKGGDEVRHLLA